MTGSWQHWASLYGFGVHDALEQAIKEYFEWSLGGKQSTPHCIVSTVQHRWVAASNPSKNAFTNHQKGGTLLIRQMSNSSSSQIKFIAGSIKLICWPDIRKTLRTFLNFRISISQLRKFSPLPTMWGCFYHHLLV